MKPIDRHIERMGPIILGYFKAGMFALVGPPPYHPEKPPTTYALLKGKP